MEFQNKNGENKIFIDDNLTEIMYISSDEIIKVDISFITLKNNRPFEILFTEEKITLEYIDMIRYKINDDILYFYNDKGHCICEKRIDADEIISISLGDVKNQFQLINLTTIRLPKFLFEETMSESYPKFEIKISDCIYSLRIYVNDHEYIDIPDFQSHYDIHNTLDYITQLIYYLENWRPKFIEHLCNDNQMSLIINKENKKTNCGIINYKLGEEGLYLTGGELENYLVEWNKFFKLVMDGTWEVDFDE